jgi:hypothetical protein
MDPLIQLRWTDAPAGYWLVAGCVLVLLAACDFLGWNNSHFCGQVTRDCTQRVVEDYGTSRTVFLL